MHSRESESGVPGVEGVSLSVHILLEIEESPSSHRLLPTRTLGRTGLKEDARKAIGLRLRRVVNLRVGDGETTGENLKIAKIVFLMYFLNLSVIQCEFFFL